MSSVVTAALASRSWAASGRLDLRGLRLRELPDVFAAGAGIRQLDLSGNRLADLPPSLFGLADLELLDLGNNRFTVLPPGIGALTRLTHLDVSENRLTALPPQLAGCRALTTVDLFGNALTSAVPLGGLPRLETADLAGNRLRDIDALLTAAALHTLDLSGNDLAALPADLARLAALRRLDLSGNRLTSVAALAGLPLQELHLDGNPRPADPDELAAAVGAAVDRHTTGWADPDRQYFDAATLGYAFSLVLTGALAVRTLVDRYYKQAKGIGATVTFADGTHVELHRLSRKTALQLVTDVQRASVQFGGTKEPTGQAATRRFIVESVTRLGEADLIPWDAPANVIHFHQTNINSEVTMGDRIEIGNIVNSNVNVRSTLTGTTQTIAAAAALDEPARAELTRLVEQLGAVLEQLPPEQRAQADAIAETTADLVAKATKDQPNKPLVEAVANGLRSLVQGLEKVAPLAISIIALVTKLVAG